MREDVTGPLARSGWIASAEARRDGDLAVWRRGPLPGAGAWQHQWADTGRTGIGADERVKLPLRLLWFGGPGPARMMTRHWGTSTPLSVEGRVFVTCQNEVLAFDAYTGRELWSAPMDNVGRIGSVWRSANFVADDKELYTSVGASCFRIDQATGRVMGHYRMPEIDFEQPEGKMQEHLTPSIEVEWPTEWTVFGPFPEEHDVLSADQLAAIPAQVVADGEIYPPRRMKAEGGKLDFAEIAPPGTTTMQWVRKVAYAYAPIRVPEAGVLRIGAGADWWMRWFLDGKPLQESDVTGYGNGIRTHVIETEVSAGDHVVAALVRSGSMGWTLISAAGRRYDRFLTREPGPREISDPEWEYLSVDDNLVLGTFRAPGNARTTFTAAVFAIDKHDGEPRWVCRAKWGIPSSAIAHGDGRLFYLDEVCEDLRQQAQRRGQATPTDRVLVSIDLASGEELWRREAIPPVQGSSPPVVQYSSGVVVVNGRTAFGAADGKALWEEDIRCGRTPLVRGDWVITHPSAYNLRTGARREVADPVTGETRPWEFARAYGCGSIAGSPNVLFFRSGTFGFFNFLTDGTTTFGGARPNCSVSMIAANGLVIMPEASAGCSCSYNFQTSMAMYPASPAHQTWYAFAGGRGDGAIRQLRVNFGAPGDQRDMQGRTWFAYPRPTMPGSIPIPLGIMVPEPLYTFHPVEASIEAPGAGEIIYASAVQGWGQMLVEIENPGCVVAQACEQAPVIDGVLGESCWTAAAASDFEVTSRREPPRERLVLLRDAGNLYVGYEEQAAGRDGEDVVFTGSATDVDDADCAKDDRIEVMLTDTNRAVTIHLGVSCAGGRFDAKGEPTRDPDREWDEAWQSACSRDGTRWAAEMALPLSVVREAGLDPSCLEMNAVVVRHPHGQQAMIYVVHPGRWGFNRGAEFLPVVDRAAEIPKRQFTVLLHMEPDREDGNPFRVAIGDAIQEFAGNAGGEGVVVLAEFNHVNVERFLTIRLEPTGGTTAEPPRICAIEVLQE